MLKSLAVNVRPRYLLDIDPLRKNTGAWPVGIELLRQKSPLFEVVLKSLAVTVRPRYLLDIDPFGNNTGVANWNPTA